MDGGQQKPALMTSVLPIGHQLEVRDAWAEHVHNGKTSVLQDIQTILPGATEEVVSNVSIKDDASVSEYSGQGLFLDAEEMKKRMRQALIKKVYNVADFYKEEGVFPEIARSPIFENITLSVITVNAVWMWIETDGNKADSMVEAEMHFQIMEHAFCIFFSFEWFVRFASFRHKRDGLKDAWFVFDSALVFLMVMETWVMTGIIVASGDEGGSSPVDASILRLFRLLRLSRLARMLRSMPELMILIKGMVSASRSVLFTLMLLAILLYIFAIAMTQLTSNNPVIDAASGVNYFESIPTSAYYLLISGVFLDNLGAMMDAIGAASPVFAVLFLIFIALAALMVMNMLIGVLCEVVSAVAATEKEEMLVTFVREKMDKIVKEIDHNNNGWISQSEFKKLMVNETAVRSLNEVGVDPEGLVDFADFIFDPESSSTEEMLDEGDGELQISFEKLMNVVMDFRGSNFATVKHVLNMTKLIKTEFRNLADRMKLLPSKPGRGSTRHSTHKCTDKSMADVYENTRQSAKRFRDEQNSDAMWQAPKALSHASTFDSESRIFQTQSSPALLAAANMPSGILQTQLSFSNNVVRANQQEAASEWRPSTGAAADLQQTAKVEAFLLAAQGELSRFTRPAHGGGCGASHDPRMTEWASKLQASIITGLDELQRLQRPQGVRV